MQGSGSEKNLGQNNLSNSITGETSYTDSRQSLASVEAGLGGATYGKSESQVNTGSISTGISGLINKQNQNVAVNTISGSYGDDSITHNDPQGTTQ